MVVAARGKERMGNHHNKAEVWFVTAASEAKSDFQQLPWA